ncbi:methyl-accepting chemotaxis protein [Bacillus sp. 3255]|uniref:methyl-accepting chemotaxis protein n=1 Tax=Bacillus sp. 3255 TaxID=2817904 RepID=UPI0028603DAA|nr:methyl-accepting chemotaxis protein [Bacillus sp. 3255]MDR6879871.1 methyl-accepting chemotaxis protein [Bacillus sp. 3255]
MRRKTKHVSDHDQPKAKGTLLSVKNRLILAFLLVLTVPTLMIAWSSYNTAKSKVDDQMVRAAGSNVALLNNVFNQFITAKQLDVAGLAQNLELRGMISLDGGNIGSSPPVRTQLENYKKVHPEIEQVYVGTESGLFMNAPDTFKNPPDYDARKRPWYQEAMAHKNETIVTAPYVSKSSNQLVVTVAQATKDGQGVTAVNVSIEQLAEITRSVKIGKEGYVYLMDKDHKYIVHPTEAAGTNAPDNEETRRIYSSASGYFSYVKDNNMKKMTYVTNELTGWKIAGTMYDREVAEEAAPILHRTLLVFVCALIVGAVLLLWILRSIISPLQQMIRLSRSISDGDLTEQISIRRRDELGVLGNSFNEMSQSLRSVLYQVSENAVQLSASAQQLASSSEQSAASSEQIAVKMQEAANGTGQQASSTESTRQAIGEMESNVTTISHNAEQASSSALHAKARAEAGNESIQRAVDQMQAIGAGVDELGHVIEGLGERSTEIVNIIDVITGIANQTNLLALNAAIEAARAGEHGRGFAVVSHEIRRLAEQSSESAKQISDLISAMRQETDTTIANMQAVTEQVQEGVSVVNMAGGSFNEIAVSIDEVVRQIHATSAISQQMAESTAIVVNAMSDVSQISEETALTIRDVAGITEEQLASMEEITDSANALTRMAEDLQALIDKFKV